MRASDDENPDLFWGLRGGGGNFGIVTEFEFELCEHGPDVLAGMLLHPLERAGEALRFSRDFMDAAPDELTVYETFMTVPPEPPFPEELQGKPALAIGIVYAGDPDEGERVLRPLREFGPPALDAVGRMPVIGAQEMLDPTAPHGMRNYSKSHWLAELPDAAIDRMVELHAGVPSPMSMIITARMGGAIERVAPESTAFVHRDAYRLLWVVGAWWEGDDAEQIAWTREVFDALTPHSTGGVYVNSLQDEPEQRIRDAYDNRTWARLVELKDRWDPDNAFRLNYNVPPSARTARRVGGGLGAVADAELAEHAADVVLGRLGADHEALGDLGVRQPGGQQLEHLALPARQLAGGAGCRAAGRAELAQQAGGLVGVAGRRRGARRSPGRRAPTRSRARGGARPARAPAPRASRPPRGAARGGRSSRPPARAPATSGA